MSDKERLSYAITLDTAQLEASAKRASNEFKSMGGNIENQGKRINAVFENIGKTSKSMSKMTLDFLGDDIGRQRQEMEQAFARIEKMSNEVFGSMSEKARQLAKDIQDDTVMLKQLETMQTALNDTYEKGGISLNEYLSSQARLTVLHEQVSNAISDNEQALRTETATMEVTEDSIVALQAKVSLLTVEYMKLSQAQRDGTDGQAVLKNLTDVQNKLSQATASMQQYARAAGTKFDGLSFSMQQIARELPVLAMSPQMFFMAISNNLPMFADELAKARKEYQALTDAGKSATPVWKRVLSSMLSWQTALVGGITLLTVYGDEIVKWVGSLFTAKKALSETYQSLDEWQKKVSESAGGTLATLERLSKGWMELGDDMQAKEQYIIDNRDAINSLGQSVNNVVDAERIFNSGKETFILSVLERAKAAATMELAAEEYKKAVEKMIEADAMPDKKTHKYSTADNIIDVFDKDTWETIEYDNPKKIETQQEASDLFRSGSELIKKYIQFSEEEQKILEEIGIKSTQTMVAGSIEAIEAAIALKNEALKKVTNPEDYRKIQAEIKAEQAKLDAITGKSSVNPQDNKKVKDNQQRLHEELMNLRFQNQQEEIDLMADGAEKKRKQIELDYQREYAETLALEKKWREQSNGELTSEQQVEITRKYKIAEDKYNAGIASLEGGFTAEELTASMNKYLAAYGSYIEKRNAIIAQAEADKEGRNVWEQLSIDEATKRALSDLDIEANRTTSAISKLFGDMKDKTLNDLREINEQGQAALDFLKSGEWDEDKGKQFGISKETFDLWSKSPEKLKDISDALRDNKAAADALSPAYDKVARGLKSIFQAGSDTKTLKQGLSDIQDGMSEMMQIGSFLSDTFSNLGDAFGSDALSGVADGINVAMDAAQSAMSGAQAGAMFGPWGAAAGAAIGMVTSLASSIAKLHDAKNEKRIQQLQEQVDVLEQSYDRLGRSIEKAYSTDASELIEQQNTLLEQQKVLIQQQIREEEDKKKTDENRIKEWKQEIEDINDLIEDNREKSKDVIFGQDVQSAIDDFAQAYADAWTAGNDKAKASKDLVKDMIQQMITEAMKATISPDMERIRDKLLEFWQDSYISGWEQDYIDRMVEDLNNKLDSKYGWADDYFKDEEEDTKREGTQKGIATASQESVDENNARLTTIQGHTYSIMTGMADLVAFSSQALRHLAGIENNTAATNDRLDSTNSKIDNMDKKINKVSGTLNDIQLHGLKIKR